MPQGKKGRPKKTQNDKQTEIMCASCGEMKKVKEFYVSYQQAHAKIGRLPYCKQCLRNMISDEFGNVQLDLVKETLKLLNRPFLWDIWVASTKENGDTFGIYMKNIAMLQYRNLTWGDSTFDPQTLKQQQINYETALKQSEFLLTEEIIEKWGSGYKPEEYQAFERKYQFLKNNYPEKTAMHTEALLNYIRYRVKEELATALGDVKEAKEWGGLAKDAATAAKINPSQLSKADLTEGLSTFSELVRAVEQAVDIIPILPKFKEKPQDKADFTIWCYINYVRDMRGLPPCEYKDIYQFYEQRKKEYEQHANKEDNIFENDIKENEE